MIRGKCPALVRVVTSGSPAARRKGLDDRVERSVASGSPEARRKGLDDRVEISYVVKGPYWPSKIISGKYR